MQVYNIKEKQIQELYYVETNEGTLYLEPMANEQLVSHGYKRVIYSERPKNLNPMKDIKEVVEETPETYTINYQIVSKSLEQLEKDFKRLAQNILDSKAKSKGYESIVSACSYAGFDNEFREEGEKFGHWRAKLWSWGYKLLADIKSGAVEMPETLEELLSAMPKFEE